MDMDLYRELVASLRHPEIIRLNYSGESIHHPDLIEAITLATATGALVELVSAFASLPLHQIEPLVRSGLDRLTVSLHTLDAREFADIYRFSSLDDLQVRLEALQACKLRLRTRTPLLDFAFVAMQRNLDQISEVGAYAQKLGVREVFVHPLIRRDEIPVQFPAELNGTRLKHEFFIALTERIDGAQQRFPDVCFPVSTHELDPVCGVNGDPNHHPGSLPPGASIFSCDQSPWDSVHVLANGDVVTCEVRDRAPLGNLRRQTLDEIWHGESYTQFRSDYQQGSVSSCRECNYKLAYMPGPVAEGVYGSQCHAKELVSGWHDGEGQIVWSKRRSRVMLATPGIETATFSHRSVELRGLLPPDPAGNSLEVYAGASRIGTVNNDSGEMLSFHRTFPLKSDLPAVIPFELVTRSPVCPLDEGGRDVRELGFALQSIRIRCSPPGADRAEMRPVTRGALRILASTRWRRSIRRPGPWQPGISVLIPECATPDHLERCLASLAPVVAELEEPSEVIVSLNGAPLIDYRCLAERFPAVRWIHSESALGFCGAIERGLKSVRFDWVYLLNSDMVVEPRTLPEVARWRSDHVFAIGSQIFFADQTVRREETGWTGFRVNDGIAEICDIAPESGGGVRGHLYAGGGSSLFRTALLRRFCSDTRVYHPMYFEDAEWGVRAWRDGFEVLFAPESKVTHAHRATVKKLYSPVEIDRIFARNQVLFSVRNGFSEGDVSVKTAAAPCRDVDLTHLRSKHYLAPLAPKKTILVVTPFAVYPPAHGSARRLAGLLPHLSEDFNVILLSDEEKLYRDVGSMKGPAAIHMLDGRPPSANDRIARIEAHSHAALLKEAQRLADVYEADLVQVEHIELAALVRAKRRRRPWVLTVHDVLLAEGKPSPADRFETALMRRFDAVIACSQEDAKLLDHSRVQVVPNATDIRPCRPSRGSRTLLFLGPFRYEPNFTGIVEFIQTVYQRLLDRVPGVRLRIAGGSSPLECFRAPGVELQTETKDVQTLLESCALTINPMQAIRGSSIKLVESLAAGRVCVSTAAGARGFRGLDAPNLYVAPTIRDMFEPIRDLLLNENRRLEIETPSDSLRQQISWERSAEIQAAFYRAILTRRSFWA